VALGVLVLTLVAAERPAEAAFPGENGRIAFAAGQIYTVLPDGTDRRQLTDSPGENRDPTWSADGSEIAFSTNRDGNFEIYKMDADGSNQIRLTNTPDGFSWEPTWSPDGTRIAFTRAVGDPFVCYWWCFRDIWVMKADGSDLRRLTTDAASYSPDWSPDGTKIAFTRRQDDGVRDDNPDIWKMDPDGSNQQNLIHTEPFPLLDECESAPDWSPDASQITFSNSDCQNSTGDSVHIMDADGSERRRWDHAYNPAWSPDGTKIVFETGFDRDRPTSLWWKAVDGTAEQQIAMYGGDPDWQPLPSVPTSKTQCKNGGYKDFRFKNQGLCVASVQRPTDRQ
jgi:Tol biopolymer transport system component